MRVLKILPILTICFFINQFGLGQTVERLPCLDKKFSIVAHIFKDSMGIYNVTEPAILDAITKVNQDFSPICVSFEVCEFQYHDNFQYDLHRRNLEWDEMQVLYHVDNRINIYYVTTIVEPANTCGYAGLKGIGILDANGIVIQTNGSCMMPNSKTHSHEMGHYFGLYHTFMDVKTTELVNNSNCATTADSICDTPADPFIEGQPMANYIDGNCRFIFESKDTNREYYDPLVGNIMSYYPDACGCSFTREQYFKMAKTYTDKPGMW